MHVRPFFVSLLDKALAVSPSLDVPPDAINGLGAPAPEVSPFTLPWRLRDVAAPGEPQETTGGMEGQGDSAVPSVSSWASPLSPLDVISYRAHCEPVALLQQVSRLLLLEAPHLAASLKQQGALRAHAGALVRWKAERGSPGIQRFREEVLGKETLHSNGGVFGVSFGCLFESRSLLLQCLLSSAPPFAADVAAKGGLDTRQASQGGPPSPAPEWGHEWPFCEVSLWVEGTPVVLLAEEEGLLLLNAADGRERNYNTGHLYLLLRAFRAMGVSKVHRNEMSLFVASLSVGGPFPLPSPPFSLCSTPVAIWWCVPVYRHPS